MKRKERNGERKEKKHEKKKINESKMKGKTEQR